MDCMPPLPCVTCLEEQELRRTWLSLRSGGFDTPSSAPPSPNYVVRQRSRSSRDAAREPNTQDDASGLPNGKGTSPKSSAALLGGRPGLTRHSSLIVTSSFASHAKENSISVMSKEAGGVNSALQRTRKNSFNSGAATPSRQMSDGVALEDGELTPNGTRIVRRSFEAPARIDSSKRIEMSCSSIVEASPETQADTSPVGGTTPLLPPAFLPRSKTAPLLLVDTEVSSTVEVVFGPHKFEAATITLERHPRLTLATLHSVTNKNKISEEDVQKMLHVGEALIHLNVHFTVMHDLRQMSIPSRKQMRTVLDWLAEHRAQLDVLIQGIVVILSNPAVRTVVNFLLGVIKPPQPILLVKDEASAIKFLSENCQVVQPWREIFEQRKNRKSSKDLRPPPASPRLSQLNLEELNLTESEEEGSPLTTRRSESRPSKCSRRGSLSSNSSKGDR